MSEIWTLGFMTSVLAAAISTGAALLYAALGETMAERAGVLNLGVEGMMLVGALAGFAFSYWSDSAISRSGSQARAMAVITLWRMPPLISWG